jgi:2-methylcitrate dehydratase PrpD
LDGNDLAATLILDTTWDDLPPAVQRRARMCLLDDLGAVIGGTLSRISQISADYAARRLPGDEATILLHGKRASTHGAAFANANAGNALDIDDDIRHTRGHPGAQIFPAALALAEKTNASGRALLEALVVGYEIASLTGRCWHDHHTVFQACGSWGSVASAAVASRLMGLTPEQVKHALGIADYHAPNAPMMRDIDAPAMSKHAIGWGAMNGVIAAELAQCGYTGIPSILGHPQYHDWAAGLGKHYVMADGVGIKRWCSCAWGHPGMAAAQNIVADQKLNIQEIEHIKVYVFHAAWRLHQDLPETTEQAQFSLKWPLAALLIDGEVGPNQILEHRFADPEVRSLFDRIELIEDPELERMFHLNQTYVDVPEAYLAGRAEITLTDGRVLDSGIVGRGAFEWDDKRLEEKFRWLTGHVLKKPQIDKLVEMIWHFEKVPDVRELTDLLA